MTAPQIVADASALDAALRARRRRRARRARYRVSRRANLLAAPDGRSARLRRRRGDRRCARACRICARSRCALTQTTVVGHALSADLKIFADRFDLVPPRVFDTQIAAAFLGYGMQVSLADLVRERLRRAACESRKRSAIGRRGRSRHARSSISSTTSRISCRSTTRCVRGSKRKGRYEWVYEECAELGDIERYRIDERRAYLRIPGAMRMSRRELGILNELVKLRDAIARERDLPVRYVLPDDVVAGLAVAEARASSRISRSCGGSMAG